MTDNRYRICIVVLLAGILACQIVSTLSVAVLRPTVGNTRTASGWWRKMLLQNEPYVEVRGTVDVELSNQPISVQVER
jgi:hypothetical protein